MLSLREKAMRLFGDDRRFILFSAVLLGIVALGKGLRLPNSWSATQAQFDFRFGFLKRTFFGQYVGRPLHLNHFSRFATFSFVVLALVVTLLVLVIRRSGMMERFAYGVPALVFLSSLAFSFLANIVGYLDLVQLVLTLPLLLVRRTGLRLLLAVPVCLICLLIHEGYLLHFFPLLLFSLVLDGAVRCASIRPAMIQAGALAAFALAVTCLLALGKPMPVERIPAFSASIAAQTDFAVNPEVFDVMGRSLGDNLHATMNHLRNSTVCATYLASAIIFGPVFAFLLFCIRRVCLASARPWLEQYGFPLAVVVCCMPLCLNLIGWDVGRWAAFACLSAVVVLALLLQALPDVHVSLSPPLFRVTFLLVALNMASGETLLDVSANPYPFLFTSALARIQHRW